MKKYDFKRHWFYDFHRIFGYIPFLLWYRPKKYYLNDEVKKEIKSFYHNGGALVVSNHRSHREPTYIQVIFGLRHKNILSANNLVANRFVNFVIRHMDGILIDREHFSTESFREITGLLKDDHLVFLFPEGRIVNEPVMGKFKGGFIAFAEKTNKPIIPIYFKDRDNPFQRLKVIFGKPIYFDPKVKINRDEAAEMVRQKVIELQEILERGIK